MLVRWVRLGGAGLPLLCCDKDACQKTTASGALQLAAKLHMHGCRGDAGGCCVQVLKYSFIVLRADDNGQGARPARPCARHGMHAGHVCVL